MPHIEIYADRNEAITAARDKAERTADQLGVATAALGLLFSRRPRALAANFV
jgi:hypothetical protein